MLRDRPKPGDRSFARQVQDHCREVQEVNANIARLLDEALENESEAAAARQLEERPELARRGSGLYTGHGELPKARARLQGLLDGLHADERSGLLEDLDAWVRGRLPASKSELQHLRRRERESESRSSQAERGKDAADALWQQREQGADAAVRGFCSSLSSVKTGRKRSAAEEGLASARGLSALTSHSLSDEELEATLEDMRRYLIQQEDEAWDDLWKLETERRRLSQSHTRGLTDDKDSSRPIHLVKQPTAAAGGADVVDELNRVVAALHEGCEDNERHTRLLKASLDHLLGKADSMGEAISGELLAIVGDMREEVNARLEPQLLVQREAEHGHRLRPRDSSLLERLHAECDCLERKLGSSSGLLEAMKAPGALEKDFAFQVKQVGGGELPHFSVFRKVLLDMQGAEEWPDDMLPDDFNGESLSKSPALVVPEKLMALEAQVIQEARSCYEEQRALQEELLEHWRVDAAACAESAQLDQQKRALQSVLEVLESRHSVMLQALELGRGAGPGRGTAAGGGGGVGGRGPKDAQAARQADAARAAVAAATSAPELPPATDGSAEELWCEAFGAGADEEGFREAALPMQDGVLQALRGEQERLRRECRELESGLRGRPPDGGGPAAEEEEARKEVQRLSGALAALAALEAPSMDPAVTVASFQKRCSAVAAAQKGGGQIAELQQAVQLRREAEQLAEKVKEVKVAVAEQRARKRAGNQRARKRRTAAQPGKSTLPQRAQASQRSPTPPPAPPPAPPAGAGARGDAAARAAARGGEEADADAR